jgi:ubiquinone/menaquinone biosynthesis C-methylase UbiE
MKLNIGSGDIVYEDYVRIDYDPNTNPDFLLDIEKDIFPFKDSSVEAVIAHHILEHLGDGYFHCLQEIYRVCKTGAIVDIRVPHHRHDSFFSDPSHKRPITVIGLKLFSKKFNRLCREQKFPSSRLGEYYNVDFEILNYKYIPDSQQIQSLVNLTDKEIEQYAEQHNNIISETHIQLIVNKDEYIK